MTAPKWYIVDGQQESDPTIRYTGCYEAANYNHAIEQFLVEVVDVFPKSGHIICINSDRMCRITARSYGLPCEKRPMFLATRIYDDEWL